MTPQQGDSRVSLFKVSYSIFQNPDQLQNEKKNKRQPNLLPCPSLQSKDKGTDKPFASSPAFLRQNIDERLVTFRNISRLRHYSEKANAAVITSYCSEGSFAVIVFTTKDASIKVNLLRLSQTSSTYWRTHADRRLRKTTRGSPHGKICVDVNPSDTIAESPARNTTRATAKNAFFAFLIHMASVATLAWSRMRCVSWAASRGCKCSSHVYCSSRSVGPTEMFAHYFDVFPSAQDIGFVVPTYVAIALACGVYLYKRHKRISELSKKVGQWLIICFKLHPSWFMLHAVSRIRLKHFSKRESFHEGLQRILFVLGYVRRLKVASI